MTTQSENSTTVNVNKSLDPTYKFKCKNEKCKYQHLIFNEKLIETNKCPCTWDGKHFTKNDASVVAKLLDTIEPTCLNVMIQQDFMQRVLNKSCYARDTIMETVKKPQYKYFVTDNIFREQFFYFLIFIGFILGFLFFHLFAGSHLKSENMNLESVVRSVRRDNIELNRLIHVEFNRKIDLVNQFNTEKEKTKTLTEELNAIKNKTQTFHDYVNLKYIPSELSHMFGIICIGKMFLELVIYIFFSKKN